MSVVQKALRDGVRRAIDTPDYGTSIRRQRGEIAKEMRADLDNPNREVRGCRRVEEFRRMREAGTITLEHALACERYIQTASAAEGVNDFPRCEAVGRQPPWMQGHPAEWRLTARVSMENAIRALGCSAAAIVEMLVLENLNLSAIAKRRGISPTEARATVRAALTRLAEHWGLA